MNINKTVSAAQKGERSAFRELYLEYSDMVWGLALKFTGNEAMAEDAAAEVFVKLYKKIGKFDLRSSFKTWFYRFSVNTLLNFIEKEQRRRTADIPESAEDGMSPAKAEKEAGERETARRLLDGLRPDYRAVVVLREMEGRSYKEIADITGQKLGTVKTNIYRAREKMRQIYREEFTDEMQ